MNALNRTIDIKIQPIDIDAQIYDQDSSSYELQFIIGGLIKGDKGDKGDRGDTGYGIPSGGTTGQVIVKHSSTDYDIGWENYSSSYDDLSDQPSINSVTLSGNKTSSDLGLQSELTFDSRPTENSTNPVESGGIYTALQDAPHIYSCGDIAYIASDVLSALRVGDIVIEQTQFTDTNYTVKYIGSRGVELTNVVGSTITTVIYINGAYSETQTMDISNKADRVTGATRNNLASLDENGNLADSGYNPGDFATAIEGALATTAIQNTEKGANNGVATLDSGGKVPQSQLPSYVDDVLEYANLASFPATGESGKIYVALDTNKTYRWSGSAYVEIAQGLALGETSSTAFPGDRGKAIEDKIPSSASSSNKLATTSDVNGKLNAPATAGTSGQVLTSDGQGGQSWQTPQSGVSSYNELDDKPQINNVPLSGNKTLSQLGIQNELTFDNTPTVNSNNPVKSGGVKTALDAKQDTIPDLSAIRNGAAFGMTAYQKPSTGIQKTDLASGVQTSLGKADTAVQQVTVGTTTTGNAGTNASVTNSGTATNPVLDFTIPRGADGQDGTDAVNPFKGWYASANALPANPVVGDYAYVKGANASDPAAIYECTTAGTWSDSGRTADTSNVQTFASGEEVNETNIDDDCREGKSTDVASAHVAKTLIDKADILLGAERVVTEYNIVNYFENTGFYKIQNNEPVFSTSNNWKYKIIPVEQLVSTSAVAVGSNWQQISGLSNIPPIIYLSSDTPSAQAMVGVQYGTRLVSTSGAKTFWAIEQVSIPSGATHAIINNSSVAGADATISIGIGENIEGIVPKLVDSMDYLVGHTEDVTIYHIVDYFTESGFYYLDDGSLVKQSSDNWKNKIIPVDNLLNTDAVAAGSNWSDIGGFFNVPPLIYLNGSSVESDIVGIQYGTKVISSTAQGKPLFWAIEQVAIPSGATHVIVNNVTSEGTNATITFKGESYTKGIVPKLSDLIVKVDVNGNGDYTSIQSAIDGTSDGATIMIYPGTYEEVVRMFGKNRHLVGVCKDTCILTNGTGAYETPPLEANIGSVENLTIIADNYNPTINDPSQDSSGRGSYGIHIEYANATPYTLRISNCKILSKWSAGIGLGLRYNQTVKIENCELVSECVRMYSQYINKWVEMGGIFFHNDASSGSSQGTGNLIIRDTMLNSKKAAVVMEAVNNTPMVKALFINTTCESEDYGVGNGIIYRFDNMETQEGYLCGNKIVLSQAAHGNNIQDFNA